MSDVQALSDHVASVLGDAASARAITFGELTVVVAAERLVEAVTRLRDDPGCGFVCFVDICGADYPGREKRFDIVYHLLVLLRARDHLRTFRRGLVALRGLGWGEPDHCVGRLP